MAIQHIFKKMGDLSDSSEMDEQTSNGLSEVCYSDDQLDRDSFKKTQACSTGIATPILIPSIFQTGTLPCGSTNSVKKQPSTPNSNRPPLEIRSWTENLMQAEVTKDGLLCSGKNDIKQDQGVLERDINIWQTFDPTLPNGPDPFYDLQNSRRTNATGPDTQFIRDQKPPIKLHSTRKREVIESPLVNSRKKPRTFQSSSNRPDKDFVENEKSFDSHVSHHIMMTQPFETSDRLSFSHNILSHSTPLGLKSRTRSQLLAPSGFPIKSNQTLITPISDHCKSFVNGNSSLRAKHFGLSFYDSTSFSSLDDAGEKAAKKKAQQRVEQIIGSIDDDREGSSGTDDSAISFDSESDLEDKPSVRNKTDGKRKIIEEELNSGYSDTSSSDDELSKKKKPVRRPVPRKKVKRKAIATKFETPNSCSSDDSLGTPPKTKRKIIRKKAQKKGSKHAAFKPGQTFDNSDVTDQDSSSETQGKNAVTTSSNEPEVNQEKIDDEEQSVQHKKRKASPSTDEALTTEEEVLANESIVNTKKARKKRNSDEAFKPDASEGYDSDDEMDVKVKPLVDALLVGATELGKAKLVEKDHPDVGIEVSEHSVEITVEVEQVKVSGQAQESTNLLRAVNLRRESGVSLEDRYFPFTTYPGIEIMTELMTNENKEIVSKALEGSHEEVSISKRDNDPVDRPSVKKRKLSSDDVEVSATPGTLTMKAFQNESYTRLSSDNGTYNKIDILRKVVKKEPEGFDSNIIDLDTDTAHMRRLTTAPYPYPTIAKTLIVSIHQSQQGLYRRQLINEQTFHDNVQLIDSQRGYAFRCCSCQKMSMVHIEWFQDEIIWSTAMCQTCNSHRCCSKCTRYEDSRDSLAAPVMRESWWDFEYFLYVRKKAFEGRQVKVKDRVNFWRGDNQQENVDPLLINYRPPSPKTSPHLLFKQEH